eukprot:SAG31_NODE_5344_length_2595_cov_2.038061_1_plen_304_part_00
MQHKGRVRAAKTVTQCHTTASLPSHALRRCAPGGGAHPPEDSAGGATILMYSGSATGAGPHPPPALSLATLAAGIVDTCGAGGTSTAANPSTAHAPRIFKCNSVQCEHLYRHAVQREGSTGLRQGQRALDSGDWWRLTGIALRCRHTTSVQSEVAYARFPALRIRGMQAQTIDSVGVAFSPVCKILSVSSALPRKQIAEESLVLCRTGVASSPTTSLIPYAIASAGLAGSLWAGVVGGIGQHQKSKLESNAHPVSMVAAMARAGAGAVPQRTTQSSRGVRSSLLLVEAARGNQPPLCGWQVYG